MINRIEQRILVKFFGDTLHKLITTSSLNFQRPTISWKLFSGRFINAVMTAHSSSIEKGKIERYQDKLTEGKKIILKQQKLLRIADREEDRWEVVKCYLSDDLASDSENEKQLSIARRDAAANKKKRKANKQKDKKKKQFRNTPPLRKNSVIFNKPHQGYSGIRNNSKPQKVCFACGQEGHFQYFCPNRRN